MKNWPFPCSIYFLNQDALAHFFIFVVNSLENICDKAWHYIMLFIIIIMVIVKQMQHGAIYKNHAQVLVIVSVFCFNNTLYTLFYKMYIEVLLNKYFYLLCINNDFLLAPIAPSCYKLFHSILHHNSDFLRLN